MKKMKAGERMIAGARQALAFARGEPNHADDDGVAVGSYPFNSGTLIVHVQCKVSCYR
jgi:hypothetical protein